MRKILIIEDEIYARKSMKKQLEECLESQEYKILEAINGKQGIDVIQQEKPDIVFTDIRMPVMDGLELLKQMRKQELKTKVVIVSAYADFEYAKSAMRFGVQEYLLKPVEDKELRECIGRLENEEQQKEEKEVRTGEDSLTRYIYERIFSDKDIEDFVNRNIFRRIFRQFQVMVLYCEKGQEIETGQLYEWLSQSDEENLFTGFRLLKIQNYKYIIVMCADCQTGFCQRNLIKSMEKAGKLGWCGVSEICTEEVEIKKAYEQAESALEYKVFYKDKLLLFEIVSQNSKRNYCMGEVQKERYKIALEKGNLEKACSILNEIFKDIENGERITGKSLEVFLTQISLIYHQVSGILYHFQVLDFYSIKEIHREMEEKTKEICCISRKKKVGGTDEIIQSMKNYAKENCSGDVTVKLLAEKVFFMNPAYLSHLFKEKTGESYSVYLKQIRLKKAKELLQKSTCSVTEVALITGYNDTSQFIRIFKQETGMTPKKYRNEKQRGEG